MRILWARLSVLIVIGLMMCSLLWVWTSAAGQISVRAEYQSAALRGTSTVMPETCDSNIGPGDTVGLINAINQANGNPDRNVICLADGVYTPGPTLFSADGNNMLPDITSEVVIQGTSYSYTRLERSAGTVTLSRFFHVAPGGFLTLSFVTLVNGSEQHGGAIYNEGRLLLQAVFFERNSAFVSGGALYNEGPWVWIDFGNFEWNEVSGYQATYGGAIYSRSGSLTIVSSRIGYEAGNAAPYGGGVALVGPAQLLMQWTMVAHNHADFGGGLYIGPNVTATINGGRILVNKANGSGGGIEAVGDNGLAGSTQVTLSTNARIHSNESTLGGGGLHAVAGAVVTVQNAIIVHNRAPSGDGGAIWAGHLGTVNVTNSLISNNTAGASFAGGIFVQLNGALSVHGSCITGNTTYGVRLDALATGPDTTNNWWGAASGPSGAGPGSGDAISAGVLYNPFLAAAPAFCSPAPGTLTPTVPQPPTLVLVTMTPSMTPPYTATWSPGGCQVTGDSGEMICASE